MSAQDAWYSGDDSPLPLGAPFRPGLDALPTRQHVWAVLKDAQGANWAPISRGGKMHDRASYRYFWTVLERAHALGAPLPDDAQAFFTRTR